MLLDLKIIMKIYLDGYLCIGFVYIFYVDSNISLLNIFLVGWLFFKICFNWGIGIYNGYYSCDVVLIRVELFISLWIF